MSLEGGSCVFTVFRLDRKKEVKKHKEFLDEVHVVRQRLRTFETNEKVV